MWFSDVLQLFAMKDDAKFASVMGGIPCLMTIATSPNTAVSSKLMDLMTVQKVDKKYLLIVTPTMELELLQNKTTNFNILFAMWTLLFFSHLSGHCSSSNHWRSDPF